MFSVKILIRVLTASLYLLLAAASPGSAWESLSEHLPVEAKARLGLGEVDFVRYSPDGTLLAVAGSLGIWLYDTQSHEAVSLLTGRRLSHMVFSPDGRTLTGRDGSSTIPLWDVTTGRLQHSLEGHTDQVWSVRFSPDGRTLASGTDRGR